MLSKGQTLPKTDSAYCVISAQGAFVAGFEDFSSAYDHFKKCAAGVRLYRTQDQALLAKKGKCVESVDSG